MDAVEPGFGGLSPRRSSSAAVETKTPLLSCEFCVNIAKTDTFASKVTIGVDLPDGLTAAGVAMFPLWEKNNKTAMEMTHNTAGRAPARHGLHSVGLARETRSNNSLTSANTDRQESRYEWPTKPGLAPLVM